MRKSVIALALSTLAFAASTLYLWHALQGERSKAARAQASAIAPVTVPPAVSAVPINAAPANVIPNNPAQQLDPDAEDYRARARASLVASIPYLRATLGDADKRAAAMDDERKSFRREFPGVGRALELTEVEYSSLQNLLAQQHIQSLEARLECALAPVCDVVEVMRDRAAIDRRELVDLLGPEKKQRFDEYRDNLRERRIVSDMRGDLSDALRLSDARAEKLVEVLGDERRRIAKERQQRGAGENGMNTQYGSLSFSSTAQGVEQRIAEASEFQRRQRERAAQVLSAGQLEAFTQRQKDALEMAQGAWAYEGQSANNTPN